MPVISPCPMGFSHSRSAYLTRVAVKTGLFATCFKTLPSSPSSHRITAKRSMQFLKCRHKSVLVVQLHKSLYESPKKMYRPPCMAVGTYLFYTMSVISIPLPKSYVRSLPSTVIRLTIFRKTIGSKSLSSPCWDMRSQTIFNRSVV